MKRVLVAIIGAWAGSVFFLWPVKYQLWAGAISTASFFIAQLVFPKAAINLKHRPISPLNWVYFVFALNLILVPASVVIFGPSLFPQPEMASPLAANCALLISTIAFWSFCGSVQFFRKFPDSPASGAIIAKTWLVLLFIVLGIIGMAFKFGSVDAFVRYFTDPASFILLGSAEDEVPGTLAKAAAVFGAPFLGFGFIALFCKTLDREPRRRWTIFFFIFLVAVSYLAMNYNRGSLAVPIVAILAVLFIKNQKRVAFFAGVLALVLLSALTIFKSVTEATESVFDVQRLPAEKLNPVSNFQIYGQAPQFPGYLLEREHFGRNPRFGKVTVCSALTPLTIVGRPFRGCGGSPIYNNVMQRWVGPGDQIITASMEAFLDFNIAGVILLFAALGWLISKLQFRFESSLSSLELYALQFAGVWLSFLVIGSIEVVVQIAVYSSLPLYAALFLSRKSKRTFVTLVVQDSPAGS